MTSVEMEKIKRFVGENWDEKTLMFYFLVSDIEHAFVRKCQKAMRPLGPAVLAILEKIKRRHEK